MPENRSIINVSIHPDIKEDVNLIASFDGEIEATDVFKYGEDFNIGEIVQFVDEYGNRGSARVVEFIIANSLSGFSTHPTFHMLDDLGENYDSNFWLL